MTRKLYWLLPLLVIALTLSSCAKAAGALPAKIEYVAGSPTAAVSQFKEENSYVVRCVSLAEDAGAVTITATKTKSAKITSLIFVDIDDARESKSANVQVGVPLAGSECDYDMSKASFHYMSLASAQNIIDNYGLTYANWLNGTTSSSDKFPAASRPFRGFFSNWHNSSAKSRE